MAYPNDTPPIRMPGGPDKATLHAKSLSDIEWVLFEARHGSEKAAEARRIEDGLKAGLSASEALAASARKAAA